MRRGSFAAQGATSAGKPSDVQCLCRNYETEVVYALHFIAASWEIRKQPTCLESPTSKVDEGTSHKRPTLPTVSDLVVRRAE